MGETQRLEIHFSDASIQALHDAFAAGREAERRAVPAGLVATEAGTTRNPYDIGLEPWSFHDPSQKCDVVAYIDDRNQVRHVPVSRSSEVPRAWRRVWLEDRR